MECGRCDLRVIFDLGDGLCSIESRLLRWLCLRLSELLHDRVCGGQLLLVGCLLLLLCLQTLLVCGQSLVECGLSSEPVVAADLVLEDRSERLFFRSLIALAICDVMKAACAAARLLNETLRRSEQTESSCSGGSCCRGGRRSHGMTARVDGHEKRWRPALDVKRSSSATDTRAANHETSESVLRMRHSCVTNGLNRRRLSESCQRCRAAPR